MYATTTQPARGTTQHNTTTAGTRNGEQTFGSRAMGQKVPIAGAIQKGVCVRAWWCGTYTCMAHTGGGDLHVRDVHHLSLSRAAWLRCQPTTNYHDDHRTTHPIARNDAVCCAMMYVCHALYMYQEFGTTRVPQRFTSEKYPRLGKWVKTQRDAYVNEKFRKVRACGTRIVVESLVGWLVRSLGAWVGWWVGCVGHLVVRRTLCTSMQ